MAIKWTGVGKLTLGFTPLNISGCIGWWDASNYSTLTLRNSGGVDYVEYIADLSGQGNTLGNTTPSFQFTYSSNSKNGLSTLYSADKTRSLARANTNIPQIRPYIYIFSVYKTSADITNQQVIANVSYGTAATLADIEISSSKIDIGGRRVNTDTQVRNTTISASTDTWYVSCGAFRYNDAILDCYVNSLTATTNPFQTAGTTPNYTGNTSIGYAQSSGYSLQGNIGEVIIYTPSSAFSLGQISQLMNYLNSKWSIY